MREEGHCLSRRSVFSGEGASPHHTKHKATGKIPTCKPARPSRERTGLLISFIMNWHMIISTLIVVVLKVVGMTLFLLYFPQIFGENNVNVVPTDVNLVPTHVSLIPTDVNLIPTHVSLVPTHVSLVPTQSYGTACPRGWYFHQGRCYFLSISELPWNKSVESCKARGSTLAIVDTPEKLKFLQDIAGAEKYFIGLMYQGKEKKWRWINNSPFNGNVTNQIQNFNCVTIGLTKTFDAVSCDIPYRSICEKSSN
ncbi:C-type lectin domain family 5 member A [Camelus bactrianus]|uniref:C-type lectin domain family 5 member A n=2 Tax=Camelus TaxID=9836 RepID=A0A9W3GMM7_CAMBA|nr:C-type lectin domain family 5 member A [Camelus bactrianus]